MPPARNEKASPRVLAPSPRATQGIFQGHHMTRLDGKREEPKFDPTVMMTFLVGLVAAVFLATTM